VYTRLQLFVFLLLAPFIGLMVGFIHQDKNTTLDIRQLGINQSFPVENLKDITTIADSFKIAAPETKAASNITKDVLRNMRNNAQAEIELYEGQRIIVDALVEKSKRETKNTSGVLDKILAGILGEPIGQTFGTNANLKVYSLEEAGYRGYMAKVRLLNPSAAKIVLANDQLVGKGETTSQAAKRTNAALAVNAGGGFYRDGKLHALGINVIDGKILTFSTGDYNFIGFNKTGNLVGGRIASKEELKKLDVVYGASFLPTLLKNGKKQTIPKKWANTRHPRTIIGHFKNGDLLIIVIDGRRQGWSSGVTLEEAQDKLLEFNVRDAYNLDGGGSSAFYYNGKVLNKPSDGAERRVPSNLVIVR